MSRAIDALVAEKVMGLNVDGHNIVLTPTPIRMRPVPHYSTDIAAAWEVVEKVKLLSQWTVGMSREDWHVVMPWCDGPQVISRAKSAPMAICLAALKSRGVPQEEINEALEAA